MSLLDESLIRETPLRSDGHRRIGGWRETRGQTRQQRTRHPFPPFGPRGAISVWPFFEEELPSRLLESEETEERNAGRRSFRLPTARSRPVIRPLLRKAPKGVAARFFQLLSGHAMIAPFLKEKWRWTESDVCWWCEGGRQSREHLFKECKAWKTEVREL